jgi:uncharacterized protein YkwD
MKVFILSILVFLSSCGEKNSSQTPSVDIRQDPLESDYFTLMNRHRKSQNLKALKHNSLIEAEASLHTEDMAKGRVAFGHSGFSNRCQRLKAELKAVGCGEIVARGQKTADAVLDSWLKSSSHRKTLENSTYTHTGVSSFKDHAGKLYWTQIFLRIN